MELINVGMLVGKEWHGRWECIRRVYSPFGIINTLPTCCGGGTQPKIVVKDEKKWK